MSCNPNDPAFMASGEIEKSDFDTKIDRRTFGLTKREYFAALAMQGMIASLAHPDVIRKEPPDFVEFSKACLMFADALIAELSKE